MASRVLVVDDDPWIRTMVATMLRQGGHAVELAENGAKGLVAAGRFEPELIVTDVMMEGMDGWTFVRQLRSQPKTALIPVIFLTALDSADDRIRGFQLGADDYLAKPFRFEELNLRIERTLRGVERMGRIAHDLGQHSAPNVALHGKLAQLGTSALLTILDLERKSGVLVLTADDGTVGRIFLRGGKVIGAQLAAPATEVGGEAVFAMLGWNDGTFEYTALEVEMEDAVGLATTELLMEGARRMDEANAGLSQRDG
ncbi:MAG: response regulator [Proteobacteria bacterium]|nr:response regulator [Pseudomonadota bacterium]